MYGQTLRNMLIVAVFSATSFVFSYIKFGILGSIALDSFSGYFVAGYFNPLLGGIVSFAGHCLSALSGGTPLGYMHILIGGMQFVCAFIFGFIPKAFNNIKLFFVSGILATIINGVGCPVLVGLISQDPNVKATMTGLIPFLSLASAVNIALAIGLIFFIRYLRKN